MSLHRLLPVPSSPIFPALPSDYRSATDQLQVSTHPLLLPDCKIRLIQGFDTPADSSWARGVLDPESNPSDYIVTSVKRNRL
ncbi:hypothetical protein L2E82_45771 [Cichorium intybus]|uniref:Uncharacterized protein n=1 Tax=Cichorium intybus TaxID=13427 RepID=A0ACB8ZUV7_CICIN|nr:hypothetical protein L2E82_45771 [Cichorium intybus]